MNFHSYIPFTLSYINSVDNSLSTPLTVKDPLFSSLATSSSFFYTPFYSTHAMNEHGLNQIIAIDEDEDDDVIMYEPTKRQKTEVIHLFKSNKSFAETPKNRNSSENAVTVPPAKNRIQTDLNRKYSTSKSTSHRSSSDRIEITKASKVVDDTLDSLTAQDHVVQSYNSFLEDVSTAYSSIYNSLMSNPLFSKIIAANPYSNSKFSKPAFDQPSAPLITESQSPVSTNDSATQSLIVDCNEALELSDKKEEFIYSDVKNSTEVTQSSPYPNATESEVKIEINNVESTDVFIDQSCKDMRSIKTVAVPNLDMHTHTGRRIKRKLRSIWKPDWIESEMFDVYSSQICGILDQTSTNEEKALKLLISHGMNVERALMDVQQNKTFYKNHFKSDSRMLRSRIPLF